MLTKGLHRPDQLKDIIGERYHHDEEYFLGVFADGQIWTPTEFFWDSVLLRSRYGIKLLHYYDVRDYRTVLVTGKRAVTVYDRLGY
jgi:hypothetical protein